MSVSLLYPHVRISPISPPSRSAIWRREGPSRVLAARRARGKDIACWLVADGCWVVRGIQHAARSPHPPTLIRVKAPTLIRVKAPTLIRVKAPTLVRVKDPRLSESRHPPLSESRHPRLSESRLIRPQHCQHCQHSPNKPRQAWVPRPQHCQHCQYSRLIPMKR